MDSGWVINYKSGISIILSEENYKRFKASKLREEIESEEHWFSIKSAKEAYPEYKLYE